MKHKGGPMMVIAIGVGKKGKNPDMENMKKKRTARGGGMMGYEEGGSLRMVKKDGKEVPFFALHASEPSAVRVKKDGKEVPFFAADGKGKMMRGGMSYGNGGMTGGGRDGCAIKGKTKGRMI